MFDPFYRPQAVGELPGILRPSLYRDYLQAIIMVQVYMLRRDNYSAKIMLDIHKLIYQLPFMMVIDQGNCPGNFMITLPLLLNELLADQVAEGLRTVGIFFIPDEGVEFRQQPLVYRNPETD